MALLPHAGIVVDVGTGSGAIALSIKQERADATVIATEVSSDAAAWAEKNRARLQLDVEIVVCDLLSELRPELRGRIDVVVSNPPYVATTERRLLPDEVVDHEPHDALFAGADGLAVIRRIVDEARRWLTPGGHVVLEMGERQGDAARSILTAAGYESVAIGRDLNERDRVAEGRRP